MKTACFFLFLFTPQIIFSQSLLQMGMTVATNYPTDTSSEYALHIYDTRNVVTAAAPGVNWSINTLLPASTAFANQWKVSRMGEVFGVTIDGSGNIYTSASTVYGLGMPSIPGTAGWGGIYKVNASDWSVSDLVTTIPSPSGTSTTQLPNTGPGLGNISYDKWHDQLFVSNFEDGKIYRINTSGNILGAFDPFLPDNDSVGAVPIGDRPWGLAVCKMPSGETRLFFSNWSQDDGSTLSPPNTIWSVPLDTDGNFTGTEQLEITLPVLTSNYPYSNPVSCINFSTDGKMLLAERSMHWLGNPGSHNGRYLEYTYASGSWSLSHIYLVGNFHWNSIQGSCNSAGGADFGYADTDPSDNLNGCEELIWGTGDALRFYGYNANNRSDYVYGLTGIPESGNSANQNSSDFVCNSSYYIDLDNDTTDIPKTTMGSCAVFRNCVHDPCEEYTCTLINVLTPNDDGVNDKLSIECIQSDGWKLEVYNRWGGKVYENENYHNDWDCGGLTEGVYYYILTSPCMDQKKWNGFFHLLRGH